MSEALPFVGAAVGYFVGGPTGAQWGWVIGAGLGAATAPTQKTFGPRLEDLKITGTAYGQPIPWIQGTHRTAGQIIWASDRREIATTTTQGKGGGQRNTTYTYEADYMFLLSCNELSGLLRVWDNGKLVYSADVDATDASLVASTESELWRRITFYGGDSAQMPDPTYEAYVGAGNAPAYRGMCTVFIEGLQLGQGGQLPNLTFEVGTNLDPGVRENYQDWGPSALLVNKDYKGNTGTVGFIGVVDGEGRFGPAGAFSGNFVTPKQGLSIGTVAGSPSLGSQDFTFQAFLKNPQASYAAARGFILANGISTGTTNGIRVVFNENGALVITLRQSGNTSTASSANSIFPLNTTFHLAVVRDAGTITGYINGFAVVTLSIPGDLNIAGSELWEIGGSQAAQPNWQGYMSDISLERGSRWSGTFNAPTEPYVPAQRTLFWIPFYRLSTVQRGYETLQTVVERLCERANMPAGTYDASDLASVTLPVRALAVTQIGGTRATLEMLAQVYHFQLICTDKAYFIPRAQSVVTVIPYEDLGTAVAMQDGPEPFALMQGNDLEIPAQEAITYANVLDDYQLDTQYSDRLLTDQVSTTPISVALALQPSEAKAAADARVADGAIGAWRSNIALPMSYAELTPGDSVLVEQRDGSQFRMLLGRQTLSNRVMTFEARLEDSTVFNQAGITGDGYNPQTEVAAITGTYLEVLDIPQLRDADNGVGLYAAARGLGSGWPGSQVFESTDELSWDQRAQITDVGTIGVTLSSLGNWTGANVMDETSTVDVNVGPGTMSSATRDAVMEDRTANSILIGDEVLQYCTATQLSPGVYRLSRLLRGRLGTERVTSSHAIGERFVLLGTHGVRRVTQGNEALGALRYFKGVSVGRALSSAQSQEFTNNGVSLTPLSGVNARANRDSTDTVITWNRRTRMQTRFLGPLSSSVPLGEASESYEIEIYASGAFSSVKRTLTSTTTSVTYSSANQVTDFGSNQTVLHVRIYQMSEIVGRGFYLQATI